MAATKTRQRYQALETTPALGGLLITKGSADNADYLNYEKKLNWERSLDVEFRRQGVDYFCPNTELSPALQAFPSKILLNSITYAGSGVAVATRLQGQWFEAGEQVVIENSVDPAYNGVHNVVASTPTTFSLELSGTPSGPDTNVNLSATAIEKINLIGMARRPNGQTAVIAGSKRRLYRFYALEDPEYISTDPGDYPSGTPVNQLSYWSDGTLFPADASAYPPGTPTLQQQYVDTTENGYWIVIGDHFSLQGKRWEVENINGYMIFNNSVDLPVTYRVEETRVVPIYEMREQGIAAVGTISAMPNGILMCGDISEIQAAHLAEWFNTAPDPYAVYTNTRYIDRTTYRVIWSEIDEPRRWGLVVKGSILANTNTITTEFPVRGFNINESIVITGAGASHAGGTADNLTANILYIAGTSIVIDTLALTDVTNTPIEASDSEGGITGFEDIQDDASGIVKMMPLADQMVIYKDTTVCLASYTGTVEQPFAFLQRKIQKELSCYYRNTLCLVQSQAESFHIYAGRNNFYRFDLTSQQPIVVPKFDACSTVFFDVATLAKTEEIYATTNGISHEIWFVLPCDASISDQTDRALCYDFTYDSFSTTDFPGTAGATIRKPLAGLASGAEQDWFLLGTAEGAVLLYGFTNEPQNLPDWNNQESIWFRRFANPYNGTKFGYTTVTWSGLAKYGSSYNEKDLRTLVPLWSSHSPNTPILVEIWAAHNANSTLTFVGSQTVSNPQTAVELFARSNYFQYRLIIDGMDNACELAGLLQDVTYVDSRSATRAA